jgi:hypothetical protein
MSRQKPTGLSMLLVRLQGLNDANEPLYEGDWLTPSAVNMLRQTSRSTNAMVRQSGRSSVSSRVTVNADWVLNPAGDRAEKLDEVWRKLAALQTVHPTTELVLTRIPLHRADVSALVSALGNMALTRLDLSDTELFAYQAADAADDIVERLLRNQTRLSHLSLARTEMRDETAVRLAAWVREFGVLVHLDLRGNGHHGGFSYETCRALHLAWNGPIGGLRLQLRPGIHDIHEAGPRLRMDYADDEIGPGYRQLAIDRLRNRDRLRHRLRGWYTGDDSEDDEYGSWADTMSDEEAGVDPDREVVPRHPHPAGRRGTAAVVTPAAGAATRADYDNRDDHGYRDYDSDGDLVLDVWSDISDS